MNKTRLETFLSEKGHVQAFVKAKIRTDLDYFLENTDKSLEEIIEEYQLDYNEVIEKLMQGDGNIDLNTFVALNMICGNKIVTDPIASDEPQYDFLSIKEEDEEEAEDISLFNRQECVQYIKDHGWDNEIDTEEESGGSMRSFIKAKLTALNEIEEENKEEEQSQKNDELKELIDFLKKNSLFKDITTNFC